jgi:hypothetical protein
VASAHADNISECGPNGYEGATCRVIDRDCEDLKLKLKIGPSSIVKHSDVEGRQHSIQQGNGSVTRDKAMVPCIVPFTGKNTWRYEDGTD